MAVSPTKKEERKRQRQLLAEKREEVETRAGKLLGESSIDRDVSKIGVPWDIDIPDAINFLQRLETQEGEPHVANYTFDYLPWDGAYCATLAVRKEYGSFLQKGEKIETLFGTKQVPPRHIAVPSGPNETVSVLWGGITVPVAPKTTINFGATNHPEKGLLFQLTSEGPYRDRWIVDDVADLVQKELKVNSIYRGKTFDCAEMPNFIDVSNAETPVFDKRTQASIEANVLLPLWDYAKLEEFNCTLKSAILLTGYFGVGKTMVLHMAAKVAQENGWTTIFVRPNQDTIERAVQIAGLYEPSVICFEDLDVITSVEEESARISQIHDMFDGLRAKSKRVMMLLTTNHVENIHAGVIRPGRMNTVLEIPKPDAEAIQKILEKFVSPQLLAKDIDWKTVTDSMEGYIPAFVREAIEVSVRYGLRNANGDNFTIGTDELAFAGHELQSHYKIMEGAKSKPQAPTLEAQLREVVRSETEELLRNYL